MYRFGNRFIIGAVAVVATCAAGARGAIHFNFTANPISAAAIAQDPALANMQSWDLNAITDGDWASAGVLMTLPAGMNFYNHAFGGNTRPSPALIAVFPGLEFDTYVSSPADTGASGAPAILGGYPEGDPMSLSGNVISVSWGDLVPDAPGTFRIMRFTWPQGILPDLLQGPPNGSRTSQVNPDSTVLIFVPEPATLGLGAAAAMLLLTRTARRRAC